MRNYTDNQLYQTVSRNIKAYRMESGMTQSDLAAKANISFSYLSKIESGSCDQTFSLAVLNQIANALDRDVEDFFKVDYTSMKQVDVIVLVLKNLGGKARYEEIYAEYERITGVKLTAGKKAGIRKTIEDYSSDSDNYKDKGDLFSSIHGKGAGYWGLRECLKQ